MRLSRGMSQAQLGYGRYSGSYISHIESGRRTPTPEVLAFIADRLDLPVSQIDPNDGQASDAEVAGLLACARRALEQRQWDEAMRNANQAKAIADRHGRAARVWEAEIIQAQTYAASGHYRQAGRLASQLARRDCVLTVPSLQVRARILAAYAWRNCHDYTEAASQANAAVQLLDEVTIDLEASALIELLAALVGSLEQVDTEVIEDRLLQIADDLDASTACQVLRALASVQMVRGNASGAIGYLQRAVHMCEPGDVVTWASLTVAIAGLAVEDPHTPDDLAQHYLDECAPFVLRCCRPEEVAAMRLAQARLAIRREDWQQAHRVLEPLTHHTLGDPIFQAEVAHSFADALIGLGDPSQGREWLKTSADLFEQADAHRRALEIWHRFAAV